MNLISAARTRWIIRLCLLFLVVSPVAQSKQLFAAESGLAGEWEITFEIQNGKMDAWWVGRVWDYSVGEGEIIAQRRVDISGDCAAFGGAVIGTEDVTFDGVDDYISCKIPNYQAIFLEMAPALLRCRCYYEGPPYVSADVTPAYSTDPQPVVYHNRLYLELFNYDTTNVRFPFVRTNSNRKEGGHDRMVARDAVRVDANNNLGIARLSLQFLDGSIQEWQSNLFSSWQQNGFQVWAGYDPLRYVTNNKDVPFAKFLVDSGFLEKVKPHHTTGFLIWESEAPIFYSEEPMPSGFGMASDSHIYIGNNPESGTFFEGVMRAVAVDPGCRGH